MGQPVGGQDLGDVLRASRERLGMSRRDLAEATGLSYPYISQLETGYRQPSPAAIRNLAGVLQLNPEDLLYPKANGPKESIQFGGNSGEWLANTRYSGFSPSGRAGAGDRPVLGAGMASPRFESEPEAAGAVEQPRSTPDRTRTTTLVEQALALLVTLPPANRLDAVNRIQANLVEMVVNEQIRRGSAES